VKEEVEEEVEALEKTERLPRDVVEAGLTLREFETGA